MIFTLPGKPQGYSNCDPRKQDANQSSVTAAGINSNSAMIGNSGNRQGLSNRSPNLTGQDGSVSPVPGLALPQPLGASLIPQHFWYQRSSNAGNKQQRYLKFNYSQSNVSALLTD